MSRGKILVTGASGFIGSALVKRLVKEKKDVIPTARRRIDLLSQELGVTFSELNVMGELPDFDGIETIIHCATPNDIQSRENDGGVPLAVMGTRRLLEQAAKQGVRRVVYLSTLQVYGTELQGGVDETTPVSCETPYALNHYLGEEVCRYMAQTTKLDIVALRPSNVYGVPSVSTVNRETLVPMCFVKEALATGKVCLRSSGRQLRNFISTDEVAAIITQLIDDFPQGYTIVNAASDWETRICDIANIVGQAWRDVKKTPLEIQVLSDQPEKPEIFTVTSRHISPQLSKEASRQRMADVIKSLIETQSDIKVRSA
ncbi:MAG: NAD(P)-dependent oxidoreductase [Rickettsiales bacterium]|nr:NAD(P)-dependent oxidoreductase [Rickettsiales bacterium]